MVPMDLRLEARLPRSPSAAGVVEVRRRPMTRESSRERASLEWPTSSNSRVASCPARSIRTSSPPGCSASQVVISKTLPFMIIQASAALLCLATSEIS